MPRAHSAYVPTRAPVFAEANLLTAESAPQNLKIRALGLGAGLVEDDQAEASPNKAGRLQHLKMRVAVSQYTASTDCTTKPPPCSCSVACFDCGAACAGSQTLVAGMPCNAAAKEHSLP